MSARTVKGRATALPTIEAFLSTGARILISPQGELETAAEFAQFLTGDGRQSRRSWTVARRFLRRLRRPAFERTVKCFVMQQGERTEHGWFVLKVAA